MGHHGVELWFDKQLPLSEDGAGSIRIQFADLLVLFADPRVLIVRFSRRGLQLLFVAVHAPCRQGAAGQAISPQDLASKCLQRQLDRDLDALCLSREDFPSRCELESSLRATKAARAAGVDKLPGEILKFAASTSSRPLFQLALKIGMRMSEPLHFKGGALQTVWKGKMSSARVEAHRGILVSSCVGKSLHRAVRSRAVGPLAAISSPMQLGGLPQRPVSLASHAVRMFQQGAQKHGSSYSLVFLDLREAFYRVIRPLFTGSRFNDEDYAKVAATLRLAPDTLAILHQHLQEDSLPQLAGASEWVAMSLSEILDCTWFRFRGSETVVETGVGSRPGDNCADLVFQLPLRMRIA